MLGGLLPERYLPGLPVPPEIIAIVDQEAAHQQKWEILASWCWEHEIYPHCTLHRRTFLYVLGEHMLRKLTAGIAV